MGYSSLLFFILIRKIEGKRESKEEDGGRGRDAMGPHRSP